MRSSQLEVCRARHGARRGFAGVLVLGSGSPAVTEAGLPLMFTSRGKETGSEGSVLAGQAGRGKRPS